MHNGKAVALGGLIRDRLEESETSVPVLADIPILGNLFKSTDNAATRTELLVLIKPQVVRDPGDARAVTEELRRKLPGIFPPEAEEESEERLPETSTLPAATPSS